MAPPDCAALSMAFWITTELSAMDFDGRGTAVTATAELPVAEHSATTLSFRLYEWPMALVPIGAANENTNKVIIVLRITSETLSTCAVCKQTTFGHLFCLGTCNS